MADDLADLKEKTNTIDTYRDIVNYYYWTARCKAEPTDACVAAHEDLYKAGKAYANGELFEARDLYDKSFAQWRKVLDASPILSDSTVMAGDLADDIDQYRKLLGKIGQKFPEKFVLQDVLDLKYKVERFGYESKGAPQPGAVEKKKSAAEKQKAGK